MIKTVIRFWNSRTYVANLIIIYKYNTPNIIPIYSENVFLHYFSNWIQFWYSQNHISSISWKTYSGEMFRCQNENISRTSRKIHVDIINLYSSESPCNSNTWLYYSERHSDEHISRKSKKTVSFARSSWKLYLRLYSYSIIYVEFDSNTPRIISHRFHEKIMLGWKIHVNTKILHELLIKFT